MHRHTIERLIGRRQQTRDCPGIVLIQDVEHPRRVFASGPAHQDLLLASWPVGPLAFHGCKAFSNFTIPSATRGPGTEMPLPITTITRLFLTAGTDDRAIHGSRT